MIYGYCRVSTNEQDTTVQREQIVNSFPDAIIREEKVNGKRNHNERPMLDLLLDALAPGDQLIVFKLDRLGRSLSDLLNIVDKIEKKGASLTILDQSIDTSSASGKAFLQMLGVFAEFETNLRSERQRAGIEKAKQKGKYKGRQKTINNEQIINKINQGLSPKQISNELSISISSVYRILKLSDNPKVGM